MKALHSWLKRKIYKKKRMVKIRVIKGKRPRDIDLAPTAPRPGLPASCKKSDVPLEDNVLLTDFPVLRSTGSMLHGEVGHRVDGTMDVAVGIDCCAVCARRYDERFRCKLCKSVVYCSVAHQAFDRAFHTTVCDALVTRRLDGEAHIPTTAVGDFVARLLVRSLGDPQVGDDIPTLAELWHRHLVDVSTVQRKEVDAFLFGSPFGRRVSEYATFPLSLWGGLALGPKVPTGRPRICHVIGASRGECEFPMLWSVVFPRGFFEAIHFFGPQVPKSLHGCVIDGTLRFHRMLYHTDPVIAASSAPAVVFLPSMGLTTGKYEWAPSLALFQAAFRPGTVIVTSCGSMEEAEEEVGVLRKALQWTVVVPPRPNPYASTAVMQNNNLANDIYRACNYLCVLTV